MKEDDAYEWDLKSHKASLEYLSRSSADEKQRGTVLLLVRTGRVNRRIREMSNRPFNAPDTSHVEGVIAKNNAIDVPMLMLFRQNGRQEQLWRDAEFWWPVIVAPKNTKTTIFASDTADHAARRNKETPPSSVEATGETVERQSD
jgi:hypothetical protein